MLPLTHSRTAKSSSTSSSKSSSSAFNGAAGGGRKQRSGAMHMTVLSLLLLCCMLGLMHGMWRDALMELRARSLDISNDMMMINRQRAEQEQQQGDLEATIEENDDGGVKSPLFLGLRRDRSEDDNDDLDGDSEPVQRYPRPVDRDGLRNLMERSQNVPPLDEPYSQMKTAICHKTIFGTIDLWTFLDWVVYHHMLGFDHIFVSYLPDIKDKDGFAELLALPYVTAWENTKGYIEKLTTDLNETVLESMYTQHQLEEICLQELAVDYDWVMNADADEYLWFNRSMGVKEFLTNMEEQHYDYISVGKWFYSAELRIQEEGQDTGNDSGFFLADYPFTIGPHCGRVEGQPADVCYGGGGRCKTIVKPQNHTYVRIHGSHNPDKRIESIQLPSAWGHFKEWQSVNTPAYNPSVVKEPHNFWAKSMAEARMAKFGNFVSDPEQGAEIRYDANISSWFDYVANRRYGGRPELQVQ